MGKASLFVQRLSYELSQANTPDSWENSALSYMWDLGDKL